MGWTRHGQIGRKYKGSRCNFLENKYSKGGKIDTDWIEYFLRTLVKK